MEAEFPHPASSSRVVEGDLRSGLLLEDESDALVPLAAATPREHAPDAPAAPSLALGAALHPALVDPVVMQRAVAWICDPRPGWGVRRWVWFASGINLGVSRRERDLRLLFVALYATGYQTQEPLS